MFVNFRFPHIIFLLFMYVHMYKFLLVNTDVSVNNQWEPLWPPFIGFPIQLIAISHW